MNIKYFDTISSTNTYLLEHPELNNLTIVYASHQSEGRGRLGRTWLDNDDLLFSILVKENLTKPTDYTFLIAITLCEIIQDLGLKPLIKWPNDIIVNDKKICGILLESKGSSKIDIVVIGVGLNTNTKSFDSSISNKATSLQLELDKHFDKDELIIKIANQFESNYIDYNQGKLDVIKEVANRFYLLNKEVQFEYNHELLKGIVKGIDANGNIIIDVNQFNSKNQLLHVSSGEITLKDNYKNMV